MRACYPLMNASARTDTSLMAEFGHAMLKIDRGSLSLASST